MRCDSDELARQNYHSGKCLTAVNEIACATAVSTKIRQAVSKAMSAIDDVKDIAAKISDKRTVLAHRQMAIEDQRPVQLGKSVTRSSQRHTAKCRKRKLAELDDPSLRTTLTDLRQSGRLTLPIDLCRVIHGDDSREHKKKRTLIFNILCDDFKMCKKGNMRNIYTNYRKHLREEGPPPPKSFGSRRPPIMPSKEFLDKVQEAIHTDEHREKDLREITEDVLGDVVKQKQKKAELSPLMFRGPGSSSTVDKYLRMATACPTLEHKGKVKHSTYARDTAIRSFRYLNIYPTHRPKPHTHLIHNDPVQGCVHLHSSRSCFAVLPRSLVDQCGRSKT